MFFQIESGHGIEKSSLYESSLRLVLINSVIKGVHEETRIELLVLPGEVQFMFVLYRTYVEFCQ